MKKFKQVGRRVGKRVEWRVVMCANRRPRRRRISTEGFHRYSISSPDNFLVSTLDQSNSCNLYWNCIHFKTLPVHRLHSGNQMDLSLSEIIRDLYLWAGGPFRTRQKKEISQLQNCLCYGSNTRLWLHICYARLITITNWFVTVVHGKSPVMIDDYEIEIYVSFRENGICRWKSLGEISGSQSGLA